MATFDVGFLQFYNQLLGAVDCGGFRPRHRQGRRLWSDDRGGRLPARACHRRRRDSVGLSATSAVVTSIVLIVVIDGLFAVLHELRPSMMQTPNPLGSVAAPRAANAAGHQRAQPAHGLRRARAARRRVVRRAARRDRGDPRRLGQRQVEPDEEHHRPVPADGGRHPDRRDAAS